MTNQIRRGRPGKTAEPLVMLGIDPGLSNTGFAIAEVDIERQKILKTIELGTMTTERETNVKIRRTSDDYRRARSLHRQLSTICERHQISVAAAEMATTSKFNRPSLNFGIMLGVIASFDFFLIELLPRDVKKAVTGDRDAKKEAIIRWALETTRDDDVKWPTSSRQNRMDLNYRARHVTLAAEHQADALAVIHAALQSEQLQESISLRQALERTRA